jgi:hypothetical protein
MNTRNPNMKASLTLAAWSLAAVLAGVTPQALAGEGHDHGDAPAPAAGPALPRFTAASELFELVGVVDGKNITLYLDRFADNSPVKDATLELQLDGKAISVETHADGEFEATLQDALNPGVVSVTATVVAGQDADLLAGELDLHEEATEVHDESAGPGLKPYAGWLGAGVLVLGLVGWAALRKGNARNRSAGGVA